MGGLVSGLFGGGKGGGGGGGQMAPMPQKAPPPPPPVNIPTTGWGGMGPTPTPQTFTQQGMPDWMRSGAGMTYGQMGPTNWFAAPWWGTNAATGQQMGASDLMYQQPQAPAAAPAPAPTPSSGKGGGGWRGPKPLNMRYARAMQSDATDAQLLAEHEQNNWRNWRRSRMRAPFRG